MILHTDLATARSTDEIAGQVADKHPEVLVLVCARNYFASLHAALAETARAGIPKQKLRQQVGQKIRPGELAEFVDAFVDQGAGVLSQRFEVYAEEVVDACGRYVDSPKEDWRLQEVFEAIESVRRWCEQRKYGIWKSAAAAPDSRDTVQKIEDYMRAADGEWRTASKIGKAIGKTAAAVRKQIERAGMVGACLESCNTGEALGYRWIL